MAVENFIPTVWAEGFQRELDKALVFAEDCTRKYEGLIKEKGDSVKILTPNPITVKTLSGKNATIDNPEEVSGTDLTLIVDQMNYFNFMIGDIEKVQAMPDLMSEYMKNAADGMADVMDKYIANFAKDTAISKLNATAQKVVIGSASSGEVNILDAIDIAVQKLREKNVANSTEIVLTASPKFIRYLKRAYVDLDTDNSDMLKNGRVGRYGGVTVKMSNNVANTTETISGSSQTVENIMVRTRTSIALAQQITKVEAYRPDLMFADAVKGLSVYGAKVIRPDEIINLNVYY